MNEREEFRDIEVLTIKDTERCLVFKEWCPAVGTPSISNAANSRLQVSPQRKLTLVENVHNFHTSCESIVRRI